MESIPAALPLHHNDGEQTRSTARRNVTRMVLRELATRRRTASAIILRGGHALADGSSALSRERAFVGAPKAKKKAATRFPRARRARLLRRTATRSAAAAAQPR